MGIFGPSKEEKAAEKDVKEETAKVESPVEEAVTEIPADVAVKAARSYISENFSESHLPNKANLYGDSKNAQAAHEAIRPSGDKFIKPEELLSRHKEESDE